MVNGILATVATIAVPVAVDTVAVAVAAAVFVGGVVVSQDEGDSSLAKSSQNKLRGVTSSRCSCCC